MSKYYLKYKSISSGFKYALFDIGCSVIELKGTVGPWWRYAIYRMTFLY